MKEKGKSIAHNGKSEGRSVWSECPNHILERMFSSVEMQHIARFRMVCKEWNMLLSSSEFLSLLPERNPWILLCSDSHPMAYCFLTHSWKTLSLGFLPSQRAENLSQGYSRSCSKSGSGLLLLEITQPQKTYTTCNPLTGIYKDIPAEIAERVNIAALMESGDSYKIVRVPNVEDPGCIQIYYFSEMSWRVEFEIPLLEENFDYSYILCAKGLLVCVSKDAKLLVWEMEGKREQIASFPYKHYLVDGDDINSWQLHLVLCGSSILFVVIYLEFDPDPYLVNFHVIVWELFKDERSNCSWKELTRMPCGMCRKLIKAGFADVTWPDFECQSVGVGDFLCLAGGHNNRELFAYSLREGTWSWIRLPQSVRHNRYNTILDFQPKLGRKL